MPEGSSGTLSNRSACNVASGLRIVLREAANQAESIAMRGLSLWQGLRSDPYVRRGSGS